MAMNEKPSSGTLRAGLKKALSFFHLKEGSFFYSYDREKLVSRGIIFLLLLIYISVTVYIFSQSGKIGISDSRKIKLVVAVPAGQETTKIYMELIKRFEVKNPDIKVELRDIAGNYYQKLLLMIVGNIGPDLMWMGQSFSEFADRGVFMDISERLKTDKDIDLANYESTVVRWYTQDGHIYGIPYGIDLKFLAYNKKLFRKAGLAYPRDNWTYEDFLENARKLTVVDKSGRISRFGFRGRLDYSLFGAQVISEDGKKILCNTPNMINYFKINLELQQKWRVTPRPEDEQQQGLDRYSYFSQERVAMMYFCTWDLFFIKTRFKDIDWDIVMNPKISKKTQWASSQGIVIAKNTKYPDAAWKLAKIFLSRDFQLAMSFECLPSDYRYAQEAVSLHTGKPENYPILLKMMKLLSPIPRVPHLQELFAGFNNVSSRVWNGLDTPETAMTKLEQSLNRKLQKFKTLQQHTEEK
ncbi:MAG: Extracellular solute-binding protein [Candidatus Uhrbacteria bacterium GW2011_GWF2_39_13]|uniref:Extracellular solute-binding protein n=1 Tax=Candidatus Uhrbacteria bacterium GW2011_GWF2_39_13 TaxID=1618995 RepID=A0A0G0MMP2_9BACT|nr:MAG: Extracellular solute-binding protein [Candidatus Uhrbacteria bacterium GW2011_GWF2_39_13]